jgi:hypothetical protein
MAGQWGEDVTLLEVTIADLDSLRQTSTGKRELETAVAQ